MVKKRKYHKRSRPSAIHSAASSAVWELSKLDWYLGLTSAGILRGRWSVIKLLPLYNQPNENIIKIFDCWMQWAQRHIVQQYLRMNVDELLDRHFLSPLLTLNRLFRKQPLFAIIPKLIPPFQKWRWCILMHLKKWIENCLPKSSYFYYFTA